VLHLAV